MAQHPTFNLIYLGGPTAILEFGGLRIITDPTLDPKGTSFRISETVTETKLAGPALTDPGRIDLLLLSHDQHWDNLDNGGRALLKKGVKTITTQIGAARLSGNTKGLLPWEQITVATGDGDELLITGTPARHGPAGTEKITGDVIGFMIQRKSQSDVPVYITGDTVFYEDIGEVARRYQPRYVLLFAGADALKAAFTAAGIEKRLLFPPAGEVVPL
jgi:L-ascorbate metabolism protein UlaG (beta-lactamase superfamily)